MNGSLLSKITDEKLLSSLIVAPVRYREVIALRDLILRCSDKLGDQERDLINLLTRLESKTQEELSKET